MSQKQIVARTFANDLVSGVTAREKCSDRSEYRGEFSRWTGAVKHWLAETAAQYDDARPIYSDGRGGHEFMLDFVWWGRGKAVLACECEWGNTRDADRNALRVAEDFDKLLSFKSPFKLMIFDSYSQPDTRDQVIKLLERYLREFTDHRKSEQYLVIDMCKKPAAWLCEITQEGSDPGLNLEVIPLNEVPD